MNRDHTQEPRALASSADDRRRMATVSGSGAGQIIARAQREADEAQERAIEAELEAG